MAKHNFHGHLAEFIAKVILSLKGYTVINTNFKQSYKGYGVGEVDVIAIKNHILVFAEVKKRENIAAALETISTAQQKRIYKAAEIFLKYNPSFIGYDIRFDAFAFNKFFCCCHVKDAWRL